VGLGRGKAILILRYSLNNCLLCLLVLLLCSSLLCMYEGVKVQTHKAMNPPRLQQPTLF